MPKHHKLISSAIEDIPVNLNFDIPSASFRSTTSLDTEVQPESENTDSQDRDSQEIAAGTSGSQNPLGPKKKTNSNCGARETA